MVNESINHVPSVNPAVAGQTLNNQAHIIQNTIVKYTLLHFKKSDSDTWFLMIESIFEENNVTTEISKYNKLLENMPGEIFEHVEDIITATADKKYSLIKECIKLFTVSLSKKKLHNF